jgi:cytochrome b6-f complex iron-sulfur subunit
MTTTTQTALAKKDPELDRREFFIKLGLGSLGIATLGTLTFYYRYLSPNVLFEPSPIVNAGQTQNYPLGSVTQDVDSAIYLVHIAQGYFSLSSICTHLGCMTAWKPELNMIACPCHGSRFSREGQKLAGPAPKPLPWLKTWLSDDGDLMVDRSVVIPPFQFLRV